MNIIFKVLLAAIATHLFAGKFLAVAEDELNPLCKEDDQELVYENLCRERDSWINLNLISDLNLTKKDLNEKSENSIN